MAIDNFTAGPAGHIPPWLVEMRKMTGMREVPGPASNSLIKSMWLALKGGAWFWKAYGEDDSKLPWCGAAAAYAVQAAGMEPPKEYAAAKSWIGWGTPLSSPAVGCIVVLDRPGGAHVGFAEGRDEYGRILIRGGNQGDELNVRAFLAQRVLAYRWPAGVAGPVGGLPILSIAELSRSEA